MNQHNKSFNNQDPQLTHSLFSFKNLVSWIGIIFLRLLTILPYKVLMKIGDLTGNIIHKVSPHRREISSININKCLDLEGEALDKLVRSNFQAIGRGIFEMAIAWWASEERIKKLETKLINGDLLKNQETGALVLIKHSTHLELDLRLMSQFFDLTGMYKIQTNDVVNFVMIKARNKYIKGSLTNKEAVKAMKWIRSGEIFLYAADQDYGSKVSRMIPFFGSEAATVTFPAIFAKKDVKIVFADVSKLDGIYEIELKELEKSEDEVVFLNHMNKHYEEFIKKEPEGYLWMHRRFKSGSEDSIYPRWSSRDRKREKRRKRKSN